MTPRPRRQPASAKLELRTPRERAAAALKVELDQVILGRFHAGTSERCLGHAEGRCPNPQIRIYVRGEDPFGDPRRVGVGRTVDEAARELEAPHQAPSAEGHCNIYALGCLDAAASTCSCDCMRCHVAEFGPLFSGGAL